MAPTIKIQGMSGALVGAGILSVGFETWGLGLTVRVQEFGRLWAQFVRVRVQPLLVGFRI